MNQPDYIADADAFRARTESRTETVRGRQWQVIDTVDRSGPQAPVLLLCPGTLGNADIFRNVIDALGAKMRVISVTYPMVPDVAALADGAVALLRAKGVERAHVLGSSLGGFVTQKIGARHPEIVDHLFIANSLSSVDLIQNAFPSAENILAMPPKALKSVVIQSLGNWPEPAPEFAAIKAFLRHELTERFTGRSFRARVLASVYMTELSKAQVPEERITVIQSNDDPLVNAEARKTVTDRYAKAHVHTFETGGHFPYITRADNYIGLLKSRLGL